MVKYTAIAGIVSLACLAISVMYFSVDHGLVSSCVTAIATIVAGVIGYNLGNDEA